MNRTEFLEKHWRPYPVADQKTDVFRFGRVRSKNERAIEVGNQKSSFLLNQNEIHNIEDSYFGLSIRFNQVLAGDWVAFDCERKGLFLLAPNLSGFDVPKRDEAGKWSGFLNDVEKIFIELGFDHLRTPYLVPSPGVDHHIDFLSVRGSKTGKKWTLPTSPEIHLKKYLCQGFEKVFEIKNCFRDDLPGTNHSVEFTMLEWYRAFSNLDDIAKDVENLFQKISSNAPPLTVMTVAEAFKKWADFVLTPMTTHLELFSLTAKLKIDSSDDDDWNDLFFRVFMEKIEPNLGWDGPIRLEKFPSQQASLARLDENGWAERFEIYWKGIELANAYLEVNDPIENEKRFENEKRLREASGAEVAGRDVEFFEWMMRGMPPASGIALGLDRFFKLIKTQ